jgi:hypothetical protein
MVWSRGLTLHGVITIVRRIVARQGDGWIFGRDSPLRRPAEE